MAVTAHVAGYAHGADGKQHAECLPDPVVQPARPQLVDEQAVGFPQQVAFLAGDVPDDPAIGFRHQGKDPVIVDVVHPVIDDGRVPHIAAQEAQFLVIETLEEF